MHLLVRRRHLAVALLALACSQIAPCFAAKPSKWTNAQGVTFKAEPIEALGPFALFRSGSSGKKMLLRELSEDDCRRFYQETADRPPRAASWAEARGEATSEVVGAALRLQGKDLVPADLAALPEPEILLVVYASHNDGPSWQAVNNLVPLHERIQRVHPGRVGTVLFGVRHNASEHKHLALGPYVPWLVLDYDAEPGMRLLRRFVPAEGPLVLALSRDGAPLLVSRAENLAALTRFADELGQLLELTAPDNPLTWRDRLHYHGIVRPLHYAHGRAEPMLVGNPLLAGGLRQRGVERLEARLSVGADGGVTAVDLQPGSILPEALRPAITEALRRNARLLPAVENGQAVAGACDLKVVVPPADPQREADAAWLSGAVRQEIPLASWLILRPIRVPESAFSETDHVNADGVVVLKAFNVDTARVSRTSQMNAFNSDFFGAEGAGGVRPTAGSPQEIDGAVLTWKRVTPADGLVDFNGGGAQQDYSIGYAWTEFEAPAEMDAWLGLGSDDGVRIWHNGTLVCDRWVRRMSRLDNDVVPLRLRPGRNQLLIKIQNAIGDWSFTCRLRARRP